MTLPPTQQCVSETGAWGHGNKKEIETGIYQYSQGGVKSGSDYLTLETIFSLDPQQTFQSGSDSQKTITLTLPPWPFT